MSAAFPIILLFAATFAGAYAATGLVTVWLRRKAVLDHPNERSSHSVPTPRGGGIGVMAALVPALLECASLTDSPFPLILIVGAAVGLAALSFADDVLSLSAAVRLAGQAAAVAIGLYALPPDGLICQGLLPLYADRLVAFLAWLWFVNLFNFMDGIDGISGVEAAAIGGGVAAIALIRGIAPDMALPGLALAAAAIAFLGWNWHPAKVFLGDVGSVPLGFIGGYLLLSLAAEGAWAAALIIPAYYLTDATVTLLRRLLRGERIWQAHRSHFYQIATKRGARHDWIVRRIGVANLGLIILALAVPTLPAWAALGLAALIVVILLRRFVTVRTTA